MKKLNSTAWYTCNKCKKDSQDYFVLDNGARLNECASCYVDTLRTTLAERKKRIAELENFVCYCCRENGCQSGCMCNRNPDESE